MSRSIHFTDDHEAFRREARRFLESEVAPHAAEWEAAGRIPRAIFRRMGELGFLGITAPEELGGSASDLFFAVAFLEELPRSRMGGFCAAVSVQQFMATPHILRAGSDELKRRYVAPSVAGEKVGALAITEPDTGSDVAALRTTARREGDHYVVDGAKTFITNGADGDFFTLAVRTGPGHGAGGVSLLVVDADLPGVRVASRLRKLGWHSSDTAELAFDGVRVPADRLIGAEGTGFAQIMESFALERLCAAAIAVGSGDVAIAETLAHMRERKAFGKPLDRFQALRHRIADLAAELEAARQLTYHAAWMLQQGEPAIRESAMAKLIATELGMKIADACLQLHGGYGFMEEYPVARYWRDARGATITAGTSEIMREIVARIEIDGSEARPAAPRPASRPAPSQRQQQQQQQRSRPTPTPTPQPAPREEAADVTPPDQTDETDENHRTGETPTSVEELIRLLPGRLRAERADGARGAYHFKIKGAEREAWTVHVEDGACRVAEGHEGVAACTVTTKERTLLGILDGKVNPQTAFLTGRIRVSDLGRMIAFLKAFRLG